MSKPCKHIIPAYWVKSSGQIVFWCGHCLRVHRHGDCGKGLNGGGYRVAHCTNETSPYRARDIYLDVRGVVSSEKEVKPKRKANRRRSSRTGRASDKRAEAGKCSKPGKSDSADRALLHDCGTALIIERQLRAIKIHLKELINRLSTEEDA